MTEIPEPSRRRLVVLADFLSRCSLSRVTSITINEELGLDRDIVRKDISALGFKGGSSNGYDTRVLLETICDGLSLPLPGRDERLCCLAGLGKLGAAIMQCGMFDNTAFKIVAGFDSSQNRIDVLSAPFPLYATSKMEGIIREQNISLAILAVEKGQEQSVAERLVQSGIRGIVNLTGENLKLEKGVFVENISPVLALNNLCSQLRTK